MGRVRLESPRARHIAVRPSAGVSAARGDERKECLWCPGSAALRPPHRAGLDSTLTVTWWRHGRPLGGVMSALCSIGNSLSIETSFASSRFVLQRHPQRTCRGCAATACRPRNDRDPTGACAQTDRVLHTKSALPQRLHPQVSTRAPRMATALGERADPGGETGPVAPRRPGLRGGPGGRNHTVWLDSDVGSPPDGFRRPLGDGQRMAGLLWPVYPAEVVGRNSSASVVATGRSTLLDLNAWRQGNSFCMIFTAAARLRVPLTQWWPAWKLVLNDSVMTNGIVRQSGGGLKWQALRRANDMLLHQPGVSAALSA